MRIYAIWITVNNKTEKGILHNTVHNITNDILCSLLNLLVIRLSTYSISKVTITFD